MVAGAPRSIILTGYLPSIAWLTRTETSI